MFEAMVAVCVVASLPCLTFRYLPMTDLPQHEAIVSIMRHMHDPSYGFERYYDWALDRTLYVFPYFLAAGLSFLLPVRMALHITVFLATLSYPLGILLTLRALNKRLILTLLALPLLYNRGFFWGFIHFNLGLGIAFIVLSQLVGPWSKKKGWRVAGLCLLSAVTHVYGLVLLSSYALAWFVAGERRQLLSRITWFLPALLALGCWAILWQMRRWTRGGQSTKYGVRSRARSEAVRASRGAGVQGTGVPSTEYRVSSRENDIGLVYTYLQRRLFLDGFFTVLRTPYFVLCTPYYPATPFYEEPLPCPPPGASPTSCSGNGLANGRSGYSN